MIKLFIFTVVKTEKFCFEHNNALVRRGRDLLLFVGNCILVFREHRFLKLSNYQLATTKLFNVIANSAI